MLKEHELAKTVFEFNCLTSDLRSHYKPVNRNVDRQKKVPFLKKYEGDRQSEITGSLI